MNDFKHVMQLPLLWSVELVVLYVLLSWFNPNWVSVPLHAYFVIVGTQTLYSYVNAKLTRYATAEVSVKA